MATPFAAVRVSVPLEVEPPGLLARLRVTWVVLSVVTGLPRPYSTVTWTAGLIAAPAAPSVGWTVNASLLAAPAVTVKVVLVVVLVAGVLVAPRV